jgi:hypothetical protein
MEGQGGGEAQGVADPKKKKSSQGMYEAGWPDWAIFTYWVVVF